MGKIEITKKEELAEKEKEIEKIKTIQYFSLPKEVLERNSYQASICYMYLLYKSNLGNIVSNISLAKDMNCSTRTISRLIDELEQNNCITIIYLTKTIRYIYPVYILPIIYRIEQEQEKIEDFKKPTLEEVKNYIKEICKEKYNCGSLIKAETFYNFYESKNWYIGKNKMTNWKASVLHWIEKEYEGKPKERFGQNYDKEEENGGFEEL